MTYSQKLRDPRWQRKRLQILERDGWRCQACDSETKTLQVHHLVYSRCDPWEYPDECYQTLCEECHGTRQELSDRIANHVKMSLKSVPTNLMEAAARSLMAQIIPAPVNGDKGRELFAKIRKALEESR
jgi:hypothetical protein